MEGVTPNTCSTVKLFITFCSCQGSQTNCTKMYFEYSYINFPLNKIGYTCNCNTFPGYWKLCVLCIHLSHFRTILIDNILYINTCSKTFYFPIVQQVDGIISNTDCSREFVSYPNDQRLSCCNQIILFRIIHYINNITCSLKN